MPYPKGIDNPFNTSGCEYLLFVCRGCLRGVTRFSYWFDNLGLITEGNTLPLLCCILPYSLGKHQCISSDIKGTFWRCCRGDITNIYQVPNHKSHLLGIYIICHLPLVFLSPTSQKFAIFIRPLFRSLFSRQIFSCVQSCLRSHDGSRKHQVG